MLQEPPLNPPIPIRPQAITQFKPTEVQIVGLPTDRSDALSDYITELLYDRRFVYEHTWTTGDFLVADNIEVSSETSYYALAPSAFLIVKSSSCIHGLPFSRVRANCGGYTLTDGIIKSFWLLEGYVSNNYERSFVISILNGDQGCIAARTEVARNF